MKSPVLKVLLLIFVLSIVSCAQVGTNSTSNGDNSIAIKAVVVTMYEKGEALGDDAGELQQWVERSTIKETFDFPFG